MSRRFDRRALMLGGGALALALAGCAVEEVIGRGSEVREHPLLTPWLSLNGGWSADARQPFQGAPIAGARLAFVQPIGVAAQGDLVFVADAGARVVWRLERSRDAMSRFAPYRGGTADVGASLQVGSDLSVWVALPAEHEVVQYDVRGRLLRRWRDDANIPRPVAVAVPESRSEVLVGDGTTAQVAVFNPLGRPVRLLGGGSTPALQSIAAMALGPEGLYVLDRLAQQVVVLGPFGEVVGVIGEHQLVRPRALAVDASGRIFVGDDADQRIKVYRGTKLLATSGGAGAGPGRFGRIEALAVDGNMLYVADSLNARVHVMLIAPPSMERPEAAP